MIYCEAIECGLIAYARDNDGNDWFHEHYRMMTTEQERDKADESPTIALLADLYEMNRTEIERDLGRVA
jgi:hypothetical protein